MIRSFAILVVAALATCFSASFATAQPQAVGSQEAAKYMGQIASQALAVISDAKTSRDQKQARLDKLFTESVDIPWVGRFVMGRSWREATDDQKARYVKEYQSFLIKHYTSRFSDYTRADFKITGTQDDGDGEYTVSMQLHGDTKNSEPVLVDYRVRKEDKGFKIFDVIVEGVSMITTQRSEFASVIAHHDIEYLITQLKNRSLPIMDGTAQ